MGHHPIVSRFESPLARAACLIIAVMLTFLLFHAPLVRPTKAYSDLAATSPLAKIVGTQPSVQTADKQDDRQKVILELLKNAVGEIRLYQEEEDRWFHNKFILIGALLGAFLARFAMEKDVSADAEARLGRLISSSTTCCALAFATIVALTIDVHVRAGTTKIYQIGSWLATFAEPALLQTGFHGPFWFWPWEMSLRSFDDATHADTLYSFALEPNLHLTTLIIYVGYLAVLQQSPLSRRATNFGLTVALFVAVQFSLLLFAWMAHTGPGVLEMQAIPFFEHWWPADQAGFLYVVPWLGVTALSAPYIWLLWRCGPSAPIVP
jgi:hypothetical protein